MLREHGSSDHMPIIEYLKTLSPSGVELEFLSLASFDFSKDRQLENPNELLLRMLNVLHGAVKSNKDCDFVQALLNNFLQNHHDLIVNDEKLSELLSNVKAYTGRQFEEVEGLISGNVCMTEYFAGLNAF